MPGFLPALVHDLRYGFRTLKRTPEVTAVAVVVLALGIGVNATVFSVANAFFFRPLPVAEPDTFVRVYPTGSPTRGCPLIWSCATATRRLQDWPASRCDRSASRSIRNRSTRSARS